MRHVDLKGRRILYVGGRNRTPQVRRLTDGSHAARE